MATLAELQQQLADAQTKRTAVASAIDKSNATISNAQGQLDALQKTAAETATKIDQHDTLIAAVKDALDGQQAQAAALDATIASLQEQIVNAGTRKSMWSKDDQCISMGNWLGTIDEKRADAITLKKMGFDGIRAGINWSGSEKPLGTILTNNAVNIGNMMKSVGLGWLVLFAYAPPGYAVGGVSDKNPPRPEHYDKWERWLRAQVRAVKSTGVKRAYEIWNEQDNHFFWEKPDPVVYVKLLKIARKVIREEDPEADVVFGGLAPAPDKAPQINPVTYVKRCYEAGMTGDDFDGMNIHPYNGGVPLSATAGKSWDMNTTQYDAIVAEMAKHGDGDKPMWCTEFGYSTRGTSKVVTEVQQGQLLVEQMKYLRTKKNAGPTFLFNYLELHDEAGDPSNSYGLFHYGTKKPKASVPIVTEYLQSLQTAARR